MAFADIVKTLKVEQGADERYRLLTAYERQLAGSLYADMAFAYEDETDSSGKYVQTRRRRPSVIFNIPAMIAGETLGELFGERRFPHIRALQPSGDRDRGIEDDCEQLVATHDLDAVLAQAYLLGQVGSLAAIIREAPNGDPIVDLRAGKYCQPQFDPLDPRKLDALVITWPVSARVAKRHGARVDERYSETWWMRIAIDDEAETHFAPLPATELHPRNPDDEPQFEAVRREPHSWGEVPAIWVRNLIALPGATDGPATWAPIVDICVTIDYALSQADRGLRYCADPMLFRKHGDLMDARVPAGDDEQRSDGHLVRGASQVLEGGPNSDAKLLEMSGSGVAELREFARQLREWGIEVLGGMKSDARHERAAQSGAALKQLRRPLQMLIGRQRKAYGDGLLVPLLQMMRRQAGTKPDDRRLQLDWPSDDRESGQDLLATVQAYATAATTLINPKAAGDRLATELGLDPTDAQ